MCDGTNKIRVLLADDHPLILAGIRASLSNEPDIDLVGEANSGDDVKDICQQQDIDILILDLSMPGPSAREVVEFLKEKCPCLSIIILTAYADDVYIRTLVSLGVKGYVLKDEATETLIGAIRSVNCGGTCFSQRIVEKLLVAPSQTKTAASLLTNREINILKLLEEGRTNKEIAVSLDLSERTVRYHIENLLEKLGAKNRTEAIANAIKNGLLDA